MPGSDTQFAGSIPEIYDRFLGPVIFEPYANEISGRVARRAPKRVLEIAAGTGIATRCLLKALPETCLLVATDLNQPMLDYAARHTRARQVQWRQADAAALPFDSNSFDLAVCQFGVMFFPDKIAAYREVFRVLESGGHSLFTVWGPMEQNHFAAIVTDAVSAAFPRNPPTFFARIPHGYHDANAICADLRSVGFSDVKIEAIELLGHAVSARHAAIGFCQGTPLRNEIEARDPGRVGEATDMAAAALENRYGSGPIDGTMAALIIEAVK